jgi:hypothetical protein
MKNDERKFEILYSIIRDYIRTAEPVGSRTIEKNYNLGISSATIRNEMGIWRKWDFSSSRILQPAGYLLIRRTGCTSIIL